MKTITDQLITLAKGEFKLDPEVSDANHVYSMFNDAGVEAEVGEFLFGLIRITKPKHILETGTHRGVGASYMASALKANGFGNLDTYEFLGPHFNYSMDLMVKLKLVKFVTCYLQDVGEAQIDTKYDIILLDTEPQTRFAEFVRFVDNLNPGGFIFIHDLHRHMHQIENEEHGFAWPFGQVPPEMAEHVKKGLVRPFHFPTPRGLTGFYKVKPGEDYQWI